MANQQNQVLDLENWLEETKTKKTKGYHPKNETRQETEQRQSSVLTRNYNKDDNKQDSIKGLNYKKSDTDFLKRIAKTQVDSFIHNNKKIRFHKERIEIINAELKKYLKAGNKEAAEECNKELVRLQHEYKYIIDKLKPITYKDIKNSNIIISTDDLVAERNEKELALKDAVSQEEKFALQKELVKINDEIADAENHNMLIHEKDELSAQIKDINEQIRLEKVSPIIKLIRETFKELAETTQIYDYEVIDDYISAPAKKKIDELPDDVDFDDVDFDEEGNVYQNNDFYISKIERLPLKERLNAIILLVSKRTGLSKYDVEEALIGKEIGDDDDEKSKKIVTDIKFIEKALKASENKELIKTLNQEKEDLQNKKQSIDNRLKGRENIVDIIFDFLGYDEENEVEIYQTQNLLASSTVSYVINLVKNVCNKYGVTDNDVINDAIGESMEVLWKKCTEWFANRKLGQIINWHAYIFKSICQVARRFILGWNASGTISGTNIQTINYFRNKRYNQMLESYIAENPNSVTKDGKVPDYVEKLIWSMVDNEDFNPDKLVSNASQVEATIGGEDSDKVNYENFESAATRDNNSLVELKFMHDDLLKNIGKLLSVLEIKYVKDKKTGKIKKVTSTNKWLDPLDCFLIKFRFGFITVDGKNGIRNYTAAEMLPIINEFIKKINYYTRAKDGELNESSLSYRMNALFGNRKLYEEDLKRWKLYEEGIGPKPKTKRPRKLIKGKFWKILEAYPELKDAFKTLMHEMLTDTDAILFSNENENKFIETFDNASLALNKIDGIENNNINLDLVLGDDEDSNTDFAEVWTEMIDFTGLNI